MLKILAKYEEKPRSTCLKLILRGVNLGTYPKIRFRASNPSLILGSTSYIPAHFIDGMVDLVVWGHEHQCLLQPELTVSGDKEIFISQPGSSVGKIILQFSKQTLGLKNSI